MDNSTLILYLLDIHGGELSWDLIEEETALEEDYLVDLLYMHTQERALEEDMVGEIETYRLLPGALPQIADKPRFWMEQFWSLLGEIGWDSHWALHRKVEAWEKLRVAAIDEDSRKRLVREALTDFWGNGLKLKDAWYDVQLERLREASGRGFNPESVQVVRGAFDSAEISYTLAGSKFSQRHGASTCAVESFYTELVNGSLESAGETRRFVSLRPGSWNMAFTSPASIKQLHSLGYL